MKKRKANLKWTPVGNVCAYCRRGIGSEVRIRCAECGPKTLPPGVAAPLHFCVECFSAGVEVFGHSASHKYSVIENASIYPLSKEGRPTRAPLLEGASQFGYGNWVDVAEHVGGGKTRDRAKRHYEKFFLLNAELDLPAGAAGHAARRRGEDDGPRRGAGAPQTSACRRRPRRRRGRRARRRRRAGQRRRRRRACGGQPPLRREFDVEWDNDAELLVMDVEFIDGEPADERALAELLKAHNTTLDDASGGASSWWRRGQARDPHEIERQRQRRGQSKYTGVQQQTSGRSGGDAAVRPLPERRDARAARARQQEEARSAARRPAARARAGGRRPGGRRHRRRRRRLRRRRRPRGERVAAAVARRGVVQRGSARAARPPAYAPRPRPPRPAFRRAPSSCSGRRSTRCAPPASTATTLASGWWRRLSRILIKLYRTIVTRSVT